MAFYKKANAFDLGELGVENIFISDIMPSASGTHVKVYLMGLYLSKSDEASYRMSNRALATMLGLPLQDIVESWRYWEKQGIVLCHDQGVADEFDVEFLSLRALYIENNFTQKNQIHLPKVVSTPDKKEKNAFSRLYRDIEHIIGGSLNGSDYRIIGDLYTNYYPDHEIITFAYDWCYNVRGLKTSKSVKSIVSGWIKGGLYTLEDIKTSIDATDERYGIYKDILKAMGLSFRLPNQAEKEAIDLWLDVYKITQKDLLEFIVFFSKKTTNLNLNYLHTALTSCYQNGITKVDAYIENNRPQQKTMTSPASDKKKKSTIEKEKTYTEEELEALLLSKNRR